MPEMADMVSVPGDCPFLPADLVARLQAARAAAGVPLACARSGDWRHPTVGLWRVELRHDLRRALVEEDLRKIEVWTSRNGVAIAEWPSEPVDPFFNVNTPADAGAAERMAKLL
jgi:molybdopterin-guanine dinucleotide biosynthesis protein A